MKTVLDGLDFEWKSFMSIKVVHNYLKKKMVSSFIFALFIKYLSSIAKLPGSENLQSHFYYTS